MMTKVEVLHKIKTCERVYVHVNGVLAGHSACFRVSKREAMENVRSVRHELGIVAHETGGWLFLGGASRWWPADGPSL